jgi:3-oxoadipate enol-lactonase
MINWHQGAAKLRYARDGEAGPSVVLIHELGGSLDSWDGVVASLDKDFRILRYDMRGAGQSETPPKPFTIDDWVEDLRDLLAATKLPPPYHLVGGAVGALIATAYALKYPQALASVTLLAAALGASPARREEMIARTKVVLEKGMAEITDAALERSYPPVVRHDKAQFERFRQGMLRANVQGYVYCNLVLANTNLESRLGELKVPVQFIAGIHDPLRTPAIVKDLAAKVPAARFEEVNSGHFMHVQTPQLVADKIRAFVSQHQAK